MAQRILTLNLDNDIIPYMDRINFNIIDENFSTESTTYTITSSDTSVAAVDSINYYIYGLSAGTATITVTAAATANFEETVLTQIITVSNKISNEIYITFKKNSNEWANKMPNIYSVSSTSNFYPDNTFRYNSFDTLRSKQIGRNGSTITTITFTLAAEGLIELPYIVESEGPDYFTGTLDGTQWFKVSGKRSWQIISKNLTAGEHTLELKYTKDYSIDSYSDAGAIGYIKLVGVSPIYYLIKSQGKFYTINNKSTLEEVNITSLNGDAFENHGTFTKPTSVLLKTLIDPEVLYWWNNDSKPLEDYSLKVNGAPRMPQVLISKSYNIPEDDYIYDLMIESNQTASYNNPDLTVTPGIYYSISFNNGQDWRIYHPDSKMWVTDTSSESGMSEKILTNIPSAKWKEEMEFWNSKNIQIRISIIYTYSRVDTLTLDYTENLMKEVFK